MINWDEVVITVDDEIVDAASGQIMIFVAGEPGHSATIAVGTIELLPAGSDPYVENVGTPNDAIFNFGIPLTPQVWGAITGDLTDQTDLKDALDAKANTADLGDLAAKDKADWDTDIDNIPTSFPPSSHNHDDRYYTETETDNKLALKAPLASPALTGTPTAPTAAPGTNNTQIASAAFVQGEIASAVADAMAEIMQSLICLQVIVDGDDYKLDYCGPFTITETDGIYYMNWCGMTAVCPFTVELIGTDYVLTYEP